MSARNYDIVIADGRVIDPETGLDAIRNVGIRGSKIKAVSEQPLAGKTVIPASGLVVAPGFVDLKCRTQSIPADRIMAFDGVTSVLELDSGILPVGAWYAAQAESGRALNYGVGVAWDLASHAVLNSEGKAFAGASSYVPAEIGQSETSSQVATREHMDRILTMVEEGLREGGIGISCRNVLPAWVLEMVAALAAQYDVPFFFRNESGLSDGSGTFIEGWIRMIRISALTGAHIHLSQRFSTNLDDIKGCLEVVKNAQRNGLWITLDTNPFDIAYGTNGDPARLPQYPVYAETGWSNPMDKTTVTAQKDRKHSRQLPGSVPGEIQEQQASSPKLNSQYQAWVDALALFPGSAIASGDMPMKMLDGSNLDDRFWGPSDEPNADARMAGHFAHFVSKYVRKGKKISLIQAIEKCSLIPAQILEKSTPAMRRKGRLQAGADADVIVFDLDKFEHQATFERPSIASVGVQHVLVNGTPLISDGELDIMALPGRPVRRSNV